MKEIIYIIFVFFCFQCKDNTQDVRKGEGLSKQYIMKLAEKGYGPIVEPYKIVIPIKEQFVCIENVYMHQYVYEPLIGMVN